MMTRQTNGRCMLAGLVLVLAGGLGALVSFSYGPSKYLVLPLALIGVGMMVAAIFTPVHD